MANTLVALAFIFMVLAPCFVAMNTGLHSGADDATCNDPEEQAHLAALRARIPD